jgi:hypothetical protein
MLDDADHWSKIKFVWKAGFQKGYFSKKKQRNTGPISCTTRDEKNAV